MHRRLTVLAITACALVALTAAQAVLVVRPSPVTKEACERIVEGMTEAEVEAPIGRPPGDYRTKPVIGYMGSGGGVAWAVWSGAEAEVGAHLEGGVVHGHFVYESSAEGCSVRDVIAFRVERIRERWFPSAP